MADSSKNSNQTAWPVIVNSKLRTSELCKILKTQHKVKVSDSTIEGSCIFPVSSVAFLVLHMQEIMEPDTHAKLGAETVNTPTAMEAVRARLDRCLSVHRCPYIVCIAPMFGESILQMFCGLQRKYKDTSLQFLPAHNEQECVQVMNTIAKTQCKPSCEILRTRLLSIRRRQVRSEETRDGLFAPLPVSQHERQILQDTLGSIRNVSMATEQDFLDYTSLDRESIKAVMDFFRV